MNNHVGLVTVLCCKEFLELIGIVTETITDNALLSRHVGMWLDKRPNVVSLDGCLFNTSYDKNI